MRRCRNDKTIGLIGVLERKFAGYPRERFACRTRDRGGLVGSRLPSESLDRISDKAWLGIVQSKRVSEGRDSVRRRWLDGHCEDASIEMFARDMQRMAKRFPKRFGRLALRFPDDVHPSYRAAILDGLKETEPREVPDDEKEAWTPAPISLIEQVLARFSGTTGRSYASSFCWLLRDRCEERWSDAAYRQLAEYACNHPDPEEDRLCIGNPGGGFESSEATVGNLEDNALNCVRGVAAMAIGRQLWDHSDLFERFRPAIADLCRDPHPAVRVAAVGACVPILNLDRDFAIHCFCEASVTDLRVAASREGIQFFNLGMEGHREQLTSLVTRMLAAPQPDVVQEAASEVAARWLFHGYFAETIEACLQGSVPQRIGLARIAAAFVAKPEHFDKCRRLAECLKDDPQKEVRLPLLSIFRNMDVLQLRDGVAFMQSLIQSQTFRDDPTMLIYGLGDHSGDMMPFSDVLLSICEQLAGPLRDAPRELPGAAHDIALVVPILIRLYEQAAVSRSTEIVNRCLDALDAMFEERVGAIRKLAQAIG